MFMPMRLGLSQFGLGLVGSSGDGIDPNDVPASVTFDGDSDVTFGRE